MSQRPQARVTPVPHQPVIARAFGRRAVFLAERRMPGLTESDLAAVERALVEASRRVSSEGTPVRYLRSSYVPVEQRWLGLFVSTSPEAVNRVFGIAQVPDGPVVEVADTADDTADDTAHDSATDSADDSADGPGAHQATALPPER
jgi:hypothetical protein